jgi:anti-sigma factor RsiW
MTAAIDGELRPDRQQALDRHVAGCPACRDELATTTTMLDALAGLPVESDVPARLEQATLRRVRQLADAPVRAERWWSSWTLPAAAVAAAAVAAVVLSARPESPSAPPPAASVASAPAPAPSQVARAAAERPAAAVVAEAGRKKVVVGEPPSEPPPALAAAPDLFVNLPVLRHLEKLEHFDAIQTTTLNGAPADPGGEGERSSG